MSKFLDSREQEVAEDAVLEEEPPIVEREASPADDPSRLELERLAQYEQWLDERSEGLVLRDLPHACLVLDGLRRIKENGNQSTTSLLLGLLKITEKPFIEARSSERLTAQGREFIQNYLYQVTQLLSLPSVQIKLAVLHTLRCVVNGGVNPTVLKSTFEPSSSSNGHASHLHTVRSGDEAGSSASVTDVDYIITRLYSSGCMQVIVEQFASVVHAIDYHRDDDLLRTKAAAASATSSTVNNLGGQDELAWYGLPVHPSSRNSNQQEEGPVEEERSPEVPDGDTLDAATVAVVRDLSSRFLDLCVDLCMNVECAAILSELGLCGSILVAIQKDVDHDPRDRRIPTWLDLLWTSLESFLEQVHKDQANGDQRKYLLMKHETVLDLAFAVRVLKNLLLHLLHDGFRQFDKECRNEVVIVLALLAEFPKAMGHFLTTGVFDVLITYACVEEYGHANWPYFCKHIANSRNFGTSGDFDLDFKKQVWILISTLLRGNDTDALLCFAASPLMLVMLQYLEQEAPETSLAATTTGKKGESSYLESKTLQSPSAGSPSSPHWDDLAPPSFTLDDAHKRTHDKFKPKTSLQMSTRPISLDGVGLGSKRGLIASLSPSKLREFQVQACIFLVHHAPKVLGEFERLDGPARILALALKHCRSEHPEQKVVVLHCLLLLYRCLVNSPTVRSYLEETGAVQSLLSIFVHCPEESSRAQAVRILSCLCAPARLVCQAQILAAQGLQALLMPLRAYVVKRPALVGLKAGLRINQHADGGEPLVDPTENPYGGEISVLVLAVLDCLREAVVGNPHNELYWADLEGVDALLDLLEISTFVLRLAVLRLLADLLSNPKLRVYAHVWRSSKTLRSAAQLFCHAWMDEEARSESERKEKGVICDLFHPLQSQRWAMSEQDKNRVLLARAVPGTKESSFVASQTVSRLATAILASRNAIQTNLPLFIVQQALACDQRVVLAALFDCLDLFTAYGVQDAANPFRMGDWVNEAPDTAGSGGGGGWAASRAGSSLAWGESGRGPISGSSAPQSGDALLSPRERQVLAIAKKFPLLREGEWWQEVDAHIAALGVVAIEADEAIKRLRQEVVFDAAVAVQTEQMALCEVDHAIQKEGEDQYIGQLLTKKHQQIKAEWLKRRTKSGGKVPGKTSAPASRSKTLS